MKRFSAIFLTAAVAFTAILPSNMVSAHVETLEIMNICNEEIVNETTQYFEDGSYVTITVTKEAQVTTRSSVYNQSGSKSYVFRNKYGTELCRFKVHGTFSVNPGVSATCTQTSYSSSITDTEWAIDSAAAYASGNQAIGDATFIHKRYGITLDTRNCHVVLTCDENGVLK